MHENGLAKRVVALCWRGLGLFVGLCCLYLGWVALHPVAPGDYQGNPRWNPTARMVQGEEYKICRSRYSRRTIWCLFGWRFRDELYHVDG